MHAKEITALVDVAETMLAIRSELEQNTKVAGPIKSLIDKIDSVTIRAWESVLSKFPGLCSLMYKSTSALKGFIAGLERESQRMKAFMRAGDADRARRAAIDIATMLLGLPRGASQVLYFASKLNDQLLASVVRAAKFLLKVRVKYGPESYLSKKLMQTCTVKLPEPKSISEKEIDKIEDGLHKELRIVQRSAAFSEETAKIVVALTKAGHADIALELLEEAQRNQSGEETP